MSFPNLSMPPLSPWRVVNCSHSHDTFRSGEAVGRGVWSCINELKLMWDDEPPKGRSAMVKRKNSTQAGISTRDGVTQLFPWASAYPALGSPSLCFGRGEGSGGREEHHGDLLLSDLGSWAAKEIIPWSRKCFKKISFCLKDEQGVQFGTGWDWQAAGLAFTVGDSYPGFVLSCLLLKQKPSCSGTCPFVHNHRLQGKLPSFPLSGVARNGFWSF